MGTFPLGRQLSSLILKYRVAISGSSFSFAEVEPGFPGAQLTPMDGWAFLFTQWLVLGPRHHVPRLGDVRCHTLDKENDRPQQGLPPRTQAVPGTLGLRPALLCGLLSRALSP